ncbi:hypothetical protein KP509_1Z065100 [Ceratopteris richardii]|nr:hypothetical protein KP509_1Z065100 [Ceratopteris richardii]
MAAPPAFVSFYAVAWPLLFLFSTALTAIPAVGLHNASLSTSESTHGRYLTQAKSESGASAGRIAGKSLGTGNAYLKRKLQVVGGGAGVVRSSPARPMPAYRQTASPAPLPEFPTLGPPIVWSSPAIPMPASKASPPLDMPSQPETGKYFPSPYSAPTGIRSHRTPQTPSPLAAAEPVISPIPSGTDEPAPVPVAGGAPSFIK